MKIKKKNSSLIWLSGISIILGLSSACSPGGSTASNDNETQAVVSACGGANVSSGLLTNGDFEAGVGSWSGNAANVLQDSNGNNVNYANVEAAGNAWDVNLSLVVEITQGQTYKLTFSAMSDGDRSMVAGIGQNAAPYAASTQTVNLTTTCSNYELELTAATFGDNNSRVLFDMGAAAGEVIIDDVALVVTTPSADAAPNSTAPSPSENNTISVFSDAYTDISTVNLNPNWNQGTVTTEVTIAGGNVLKLKSLNYQGIEFGGSEDISSKTTLHLDYWTDDSTSLDVYLISDSPVVETAHTVTVTTGSWQSLEIPLASFSSVVDLTDVFQMKFVGNGTIYLDNIYFY